jgi:hypothetical protein
VLADRSVTARLYELNGVYGLQAGPCLVGSDGTHHVSEISRTLAGVDLVHHGAQLEGQQVAIRAASELVSCRESVTLHRSELIAVA